MGKGESKADNTVMNPAFKSLETADGKKVVNPMEKSRKIRDVLFLIIFYAFLLSIFGIAGWAYQEGNPKALFFGLDYRGRVCDEGDVKGFKARYWVNPGQIIASVVSDPTNFYDAKSVCLKKCPKVNEETTANYTMLHFVCNYPDGYGRSDQFPNPSATGAASPVPMTYEQWADTDYDFYNLLSDEQKASSLQLKGPCFPVLMKTTNQLGACQPYGGIIGYENNDSLYKIWRDIGGVEVDDLDSIIEKSVFNYIEDPVRVMGRYMRDIATAWVPILVAGVGSTVILSYVWLFLLKFFAGVMAWLTIIVANIGMVALSVMFYMKAGVFSADQLDAFMGTDFDEDLPSEFDASEKNKDTLMACAIAATIVTVLVFIATLFMIKKIRVALRCIEVGRRAVSHSPLIMLYPMTIPFLFSVGFTAFWIFGIVYLFSTGDVIQRSCDINSAEAEYMGLGSNPNCGPTESCQCGYQLAFEKNMQYMALYFLFGLLWILQFSTGFTKVVVAGSVAPYYWMRGQEDGRGFFEAFKNALKYHQGSVALGSFLIAFIQFIRLIMKIIFNRLRHLKEKSDFFKYCMYCVSCCLWCLQGCIAYLTNNAFVIVAIEGKGFFGSAMRSGKLLMNNALTSAAVQIVGDSILAIAQLAVVAGAGVACFAILENPSFLHGDMKVSSPLLPVVSSMIVAYLLSSKFFAVIETSIDTMFLSFCLDCEMHGGKALLAPPSLQAMVNSSGDEE